MPTYEFENQKTGEKKEMCITYEERQKFLKDNPDWKYVIAASSISFDTINVIKRAGSGWNDVLKGIKKASGAKGNNIDTY